MFGDCETEIRLIFFLFFFFYLNLSFSYSSYIFATCSCKFSLLRKFILVHYFPCIFFIETRGRTVEAKRNKKKGNHRYLKINVAQNKLRTKR